MQDAPAVVQGRRAAARSYPQASSDGWGPGGCESGEAVEAVIGRRSRVYFARDLRSLFFSTGIHRGGIFEEFFENFEKLRSI